MAIKEKYVRGGVVFEGVTYDSKTNAINNDPMLRLVYVKDKSEQHRGCFVMSEMEWRDMFGPPPFDLDVDQETICRCSHLYERHFDSYDDMAPIGCKYCDCREFHA